MTFASLLRVLREQWPTLVAGALVGLLAAGVVTWLTPRSYSASASVYVATIDATPGGDAFTGTLLVPQRVASYRQLLTSSRVLEPVQVALGVPVNAGTVAAVSQTDSATFTALATARDPQQAAAVANAVVARFAVVVGELERPGGPAGPAGVAATVVDRADAPTAPVSPKPAINLLAGLVVGLAAALAAVLVRAAADTRLRSTSALRDVVGGAALGALPRPGRRGDGGTTRDAARDVRARLRLATEHDPAPVLAFTSTRPGEGTAATVIAVAEAFATRARVLVVDADLRHPSLGDRLGVDAGAGFAEVLAGSVSVEAAVVPRGDERSFDVIGVGAVPGDPGDLIASGAAAAVAGFRAGYDLVLLDAGAATSTDAVLVARQADGTVVICCEGATPRDRVEAAVAGLRSAGARIVGSVLVEATPAGAAAPSSVAPSEGGHDLGSPAEVEPHLVATETGATARNGRVAHGGGRTS